MTWTADRLSRMATDYWHAAALIAAAELGVFDVLSDGAVDALSIAHAAGADAGRLGPLLDALVAVGLLTQSGTAYAIADDLRPWLSRTSPTCMLDALAYNGDLYRRWADLADVVRGGPTPQGLHLGGDPAQTRRFVLGMDAKARAFADPLAEAIGLAGLGTLLDVGAGPGTLTRKLAERSPTLTATLLDLPPVLAVAKDVCGGSPAFDRLRFRPADYHRDPLPGGFDAVLYAGALHQETSVAAARLFERVCAALRPGGWFYVIDLMLDDGRTSPAFSTLFQLNMMLLRPGSRVFEASEVERMLVAAGFADIQTKAVEATPYRVVSAKRPDASASPKG